MIRRRAFPLALAVTALLAVVALAARGRPLRGNGGKNSGLPQTFWDYAFTTLLIVIVAGAIVSLVLYLSMGREAEPKRPRQARTLRSTAIVLVVCVLVAFIGRHIDFHHLFHPFRQPPGVKGAPPKAGVAFQWPELVAILGALLVLGVLLATHSHVRSALRRSRSGAESLAAVLDESLDDLRAEPDLRRAIVAAYARMEAVLARAGFPRGPAEAPREYLEHALLALDTSAAAVRRLTDLFEWARFSHHEPEPSMRDEAIQSLVDVRDELRASAPVHA